MSVKNYFNKAAINYNSHCHLQLQTGEKLISLIDSANNVIDLGCGAGSVTVKLKYKKLYCLDISEEMLEQTKLKIKNNEVTYLEQSFDNFSGLCLDLAFANMSLQWSENLMSTINNIKDNLKVGGVLAFSIPIEGTFLDLNVSKLSFYSLNEVRELLLDWKIIHISSQEINYPFPSLIDSLKSIKAVGANYYNQKSKQLISRKKEAHILQYNIGYFVVRKI